MNQVDDVLSAAMMDAVHEMKLTQIVLALGPEPRHRVRVIIVPEQLEYVLKTEEAK